MVRCHIGKFPLLLMPWWFLSICSCLSEASVFHDLVATYTFRANGDSIMHMYASALGRTEVHAAFK